jgi:hypothetical protein
MIWYMIWYIWYMICYDIWYDICYDMLWCIWYDTIYHMIWYIWYDIWYAMIYDMIRYMIWYMIWYMIYHMIRYICYLQLGSHTVAVIQYTFTHKQYTEQHKTTLHKPTKKFGRRRAVPNHKFCGFYPGICLTTEEKARKNFSGGRQIHKRTMNTQT